MNQKVKQQRFLKYLWLLNILKKLRYGHLLGSGSCSGSGPRRPDPDPTKKVRIRIRNTGIHNTDFGVYTVIHMFVTAKNEAKRKFVKRKRNEAKFFSFRFEAKNLKRNEAKTSEKIGP
jgi:hypothetical protein